MAQSAAQEFSLPAGARFAFCISSDEVTAAQSAIFIVLYLSLRNLAQLIELKAEVLNAFDVATAKSAVEILAIYKHIHVDSICRRKQLLTIRCISRYEYECLA